jgi:hypothetical protein
MVGSRVAETTSILLILKGVLLMALIGSVRFVVLDLFSRDSYIVYSCLGLNKYGICPNPPEKLTVSYFKRKIDRINVVHL